MSARLHRKLDRPAEGEGVAERSGLPDSAAAKSASDDQKPPVDDEKRKLEIGKLGAEISKLEKETAKLQSEADDTEDRRAKAAAEHRKLNLDIDNARWLRYAEWAKAIVPAAALLGSVYTATVSLEYQRDKDRTVQTADQLAKFNTQMTTATNSNAKRIAIAAVRSLGEPAIPSLLAHLEMGYPADIEVDLRAAVQQASADPNLRPKVLSELLSVVRAQAWRAAESGNTDNLKESLALLRECLDRFERGMFSFADGGSARVGAELGKLREQLQAKAGTYKRVDKPIERINEYLTGAPTKAKPRESGKG